MFGWNVADKYDLVLTKKLSLGCSTYHFLIMHCVSTNHRKADQLNVMSLVERSKDGRNFVERLYAGSMEEIYMVPALDSDA